MAGPHKITVLYGGQEVPQSPINIECAETGKSDKCKIGKLNNQSVFSLYDLIELFLASKPKDKLDLGEEGKLVIDAKEAGKGGVTCRITRETSSSSTNNQAVKKLKLLLMELKLRLKKHEKKLLKNLQVLKCQEVNYLMLMSLKMVTEHSLSITKCLNQEIIP